jgi:hypothetical protein
MVGIPVLMFVANTSGSKLYFTCVVACYSSFVGIFTDCTVFVVALSTMSI